MQQTHIINLRVFLRFCVFFLQELIQNVKWMSFAHASFMEFIWVTGQGATLKCIYLF